MARPKAALTERDLETLGELESATDSFVSMKHNGGWVQSIDCGGMNGSHHSYTLHKLAARGLALCKKYGGKHEKGSCRYRINKAGRALLDKRKRERQARHLDPEGGIPGRAL